MAEKIIKKYVMQFPVFEKAYCPTCGTELVCTDKNSIDQLFNQVMTNSVKLKIEGQIYDHICKSCNKVYRLSKIYPAPITIIDEPIDLNLFPDSIKEVFNSKKTDDEDQSDADESDNTD